MRKILILLIVAGFLINACAPTPKKEERVPQNASYYYKIGLSYLNSGNNSQALYYLNKAYSINPDDPEILNALGIAYSNVGETEKAKEFFLKAIEKNPDRAETYTNLGTLLAKEKKFKEALWYFEKAAQNPSYMKKDIAYYNIALIYKQMGNLKLYEENLKKAISYNSYLLPAYISLGDYYTKLERYDDALSVYLTAKDKGLSSPYIYLGLGKLYLKLGKYERSKEYLLKAKRLSSENEILLLQIDRLLRTANQKIIEKAEKEIKLQEKTVKKETEKLPEKLEKTEEVQKETVREEIQKEVLEKAPEIAKKTEGKPKKVIKPKIRFYVLLGRFTDQEKAAEMTEMLRSKGFPSEMKQEVIDGSPVYSVIIGYFKEYREASRFYRKKLKPLGLRGIVKFTRN